MSIPGSTRCTVEPARSGRPRAAPSTRRVRRDSEGSPGVHVEVRHVDGPEDGTGDDAGPVYHHHCGRVGPGGRSCPRRSPYGRGWGFAVGSDRGRGPGRSAGCAEACRCSNGITRATKATCPITFHQPSLRARRRARPSLEGDSSTSTVEAGGCAQVGLQGARHRCRGGASITSRITQGGSNGHGDALLAHGSPTPPHVAPGAEHGPLDHVHLVLEREPGLWRPPGSARQGPGPSCASRAGRQAVRQRDGIVGRNG